MDALLMRGVRKIKENGNKADKMPDSQLSNHKPRKKERRKLCPYPFYTRKDANQTGNKRIRKIKNRA